MITLWFSQIIETRPYGREELSLFSSLLELSKACIKEATQGSTAESDYGKYENRV